MSSTSLATRFSHVKPADTAFVSGGLRDFFTCRDLGIAAATGGRVVAHLVCANQAPEQTPDGTCTAHSSTSFACSRAGRAPCTFEQASDPWQAALECFAENYGFHSR